VKKVTIMSKKKSKKEDPLEQSLLRVMSLINNQIAREMQRTPAELDKEGVKKWEPYTKRVELVTSLILTLIGEQALELDSLLVLARSVAKALYLLTDELGTDSLGTVRTAYFAGAAREIEDDMRKLLGITDEDRPLVS
jgi:hypothetical protein